MLRTVKQINENPDNPKRSRWKKKRNTNLSSNSWERYRAISNGGGG
jgi:hypothetical protein